MIYRASVDGFSAKSFHSKCDGVLGTFIIIKSSKDYILGGYTKGNWNGYNKYVFDPDAFLFSIINIHNSSFVMKVYDCYGTCKSSPWAIYASPFSGISFGLRGDLVCDQIGVCITSQLRYYKMLPEFSNHTMAQTFKNGTVQFQATEIEVYSVVNQP